MPTPAQQAAARTNGARRSMDALSFHPLAKTTVLKNESHKGFQELVCHHTLRIAPRDAVEGICSATQSSPAASSAWSGPATSWPARILASRPRAPRAKEIRANYPRGTHLGSAALCAGRRGALCAGAFIHAPLDTHPRLTDAGP